MYSTAFSATIRSVTPKMKTDSDGNVRRYTMLSLQCELDDDFAAGIGDAGKAALKFIRDGSTKSASISLDAERAKLEATGNGKHSLDVAGVAVACKAPGKEGAGPAATLSVAFATKEKDLWFFAQRIGTPITVKLDKTQIEIDFSSKE